jgi:hypothetical protein
MIAQQFLKNESPRRMHKFFTPTVLSERPGGTSRAP